MEINKFIKQRAEMINEGFSLYQTQKECWDFTHRECIGILNLEAMIYRSMELYAEIIKISNG